MEAKAQFFCKINVLYTLSEMEGMKPERPINLDLTKFHFPPMAILSISHRITGVILFLFIPLMLYLLHGAILSEASFDSIQSLVLHNAWMKLGIWIMVSATLLHFFAGLRHLIMDLGFWESVRAGRVSAYVVFTLAVVAAIWLGVWIW